MGATPASGGGRLGVDELVGVAAGMVADEVAPRAAAVDADARWPQEGMAALLRAGLGGLTVPVACGGHGHGLEALVLVCEEIGRACASTAICFGMHCVGSAVIAARPTADQAARYLEPIARGEHLTTLALSEPGTGSHFYLPQTRARPDDAEFVLAGTKTFVTNGSRADSYVISVVDPDGPAGQFSCLVLDERTPGMTWGEPWRGLGMRGNDSRTLTLADARVRRENLLGREGDQLWYVFHVIAPFFLMAMAGTYLGVAGAAFDATRAHLSGRTYSSGRTLAQMQVVQHRLGELWATLERTRALVHRAAVAADAGSADALPGVLSAKAEVARCAETVTNEAMTLCGGTAYREGAALQRHLRDARAAHVMAPTTDMLRTWTGRALLDQPLLAD